VGGLLQLLGVPFRNGPRDAAMVGPAVEEVRPGELLGWIHGRGVNPSPVLRLKGEDSKWMKVADGIGIGQAVDGRMERELGVDAVSRLAQIDREILAAPGA